MRKVTLEIAELAYWRIVNDASRLEGDFDEIDVKLKPVEDPETGKISLRLSWFDLRTTLELVDD